MHDYSLSELEDDTGENLSEYLDGLDCVIDIHPKIVVNNGNLQTKTSVVSTRKLTNDEQRLLLSFCGGQFSDGWGEGYEQYDNKVKGVFVSSWSKTPLTIKEV